MKDLVSGTKHTEGGGEPRPIRGTFSYRGFPPKRAVWFLQQAQRKVEEKIIKMIKEVTSCNRDFFFAFSHSHVLRHWGIGDSRSRRVQAVLAAQTAAVAAEAVQVSVGGVLRAYPPGPWIERVLLIYVIIISFSTHVDKKTKQTN